MQMKKLCAIILISASLSNPFHSFANDIKNKQPIVEKSISSFSEKFVNAARAYLNKNNRAVPYIWGGRNTENNPGLDCLGLIFVSIQDVTGIPWNYWSVMPSKLIKQLGDGREVEFFYSENATEKDMIKDLKKGDVIFFLSTAPTRDKPVTSKKIGNDKIAYWVLHTAIYTGEGKIIHASPFDDDLCVVEENLYQFMKNTEMDGFIAKEPKISIKKN